MKELFLTKYKGISKGKRIVCYRTMDPALAVIRGFLCDESLAKQPITVGYLSDTEEIIETGLDQFLDQLNWQSQEQLHHFYRILYIKYRSWLVWNAVSSRPFRDVRRQCLQAERCANLLAQIDSSDTEQVNHHNQRWDSIQNRSCSLMPAVSRNFDLTNSFWYRPDSPNFFLCQRIRSVQFDKMARRVRAHLDQYDHEFTSLFYPNERFHLTLCVFSLEDLSEVQECFSLIKDTIENMRRRLPQYPVHLRGLDTYQDRMLFVNAIQDPNLDKLIKAIKQTCSAAGFITNVNGVFVPHVTLLKFNPIHHRRLHIPTEVLDHYSETDFGSISIDELHFCFRTSARDSEGFYPSLGSISLTSHRQQTPNTPRKKS
ncbi:hypothetical protein D915_001091 [Fasciola hepatica]|uniref:A-kinase anchor protein 7-like phosphoesterase domain-containing protein n=1 Tax=Fasciola hepatica TaxID=6192 RepID=A0A4E0RJX6_FASHE|nr:hypothetical protein D915_001091 [Fasciola hepatica]